MTGSTSAFTRWLRHWPWIVGIVVAFLAGIGIGIAAQQEALADAMTVAELDEREAEISTAEEEAAANTFGNGVYVVGEDIEPGEYRTDGPGSADICYYAFLTGTGSDADIIDNNIVEGQARVTLQKGDIFESSQCQQWERSS